MAAAAALSAQVLRVATKQTSSSVTFSHKKTTKEEGRRGRSIRQAAARSRFHTLSYVRRRYLHDDNVPLVLLLLLR